jgi:23S rRNA (guanosine2251-2'-O)-methyltransferase
MARNELVYGIHACRHLIEQAPDQILEAWLQSGVQGGALNELQKRLQQQGIAQQSVPVATLDRLTEDAVHQGIVLRSRIREASADLETLLAGAASPLLLVLDGVQDPHNLGACLRTAAAAGADAVIIPRDRAAGLTPGARKSAAGAAEHIPLLRVTNLARTLDELKRAGVWLVGCTGEADSSLYAVDLNRPLALVLGAEGQGLRRLTRERCDYLAHIPMPGPIESLNVSVAAGVALFEAVRQRGVQP